jgi:hypothetical protein
MMNREKAADTDHFVYRDAPYPISAEMKSAYRDYWESLAAPGNWWTGPQRVAIASAVREATGCAFCAERKQALSPNAVQGQHQMSNGVRASLTDRAIDAVHRIVTDQTRITQAYVDENAAQGLSPEAYVELAGIVVTVFSIDEFNRGLGLALEPLPEPLSGECSRYRPSRAVHDAGFVPMIPDDGAIGEEADLWRSGESANVIRALSVVPDAVRGFKGVFSVQYLPWTSEAFANFDRAEGRAINRMQIELIAGRVSAYNECFY